MADVAAAADVVGAPAQPVREFFRQVATLKKLATRPAPGAAEAADPG
jgi:UDP-3-O-[3-hydroxymyristoyl] glucosamine N-acyltransferase